MGDLIKKINYIKNMAVFNDFQWASSVKDEGGNVVDFKKVNILYGRNYSGKTTLSRIFRAIETGYISDKYMNPEFHLSLDNDNTISQNSLIGHDQVVRVFNEDFVKENLRFIVDDEATINSFAILGEDNTRLEEEIVKHEVELGTEEDKSGLYGSLQSATKDFNVAKTEHSNKDTALEKKLNDKANKAPTGIKHNKVFGNANYKTPNIKADIKKVLADTYECISNEKVEEFNKILKEEPKDEISKSALFDLKYSTLASKTKDIVEKKIQTSEPIQELLNDAALATWVKHGREHHEGKRTDCAFCGNPLSPGLWEKLDKHFNKESEDLLSEVDQLIKSIYSEINRVPDLLAIKNSDFYSRFNKRLDALKDRFSDISESYIETLNSLKDQLELRKNDIFTTLIFLNPTSIEESLDNISESFEAIRDDSNNFTESLSSQQSEARNALRLHEVFTFVTDIKYNDEYEAIDTLKEKMNEAEAIKVSAKSEVDTKKDLIKYHKSQLKDESKGADRVNEYLNNFFGHQSLSLEAIEETIDDGSSVYRFIVTRNGTKAYHLSEGESSLIAFCYFMAKLEDFETEGNQPVIWIDDPISSLDSNHIFFVYSLINAQIVTPETYEDNGETKQRDRFQQLFISTHNLDFLKYLKRLPGANRDERKREDRKRYRHLILERTDKVSVLKLMPKYLREYVTEFNYLFEQIHKCASIDVIDDTNYTIFYNFGNNARKFFEVYLYYKYPNTGMTENTLEMFFGEGKIPAVLTDRINNEYSHLSGVFERGATPVEVPEMKTAASYIIQKLKTHDPDQYSALLQSIGVEGE